MTPQELFDALLERKQLTVFVTGPQAETLRTTFVKKFSHYKQMLDDAGFLGAEMAGQVVSVTKHDDKTVYKLAAKRVGYNYQILEEKDAP